MTASPRRRYRFRDYLAPKVLVMLALGFSSGLPFVLVGNTFGYWLRDEHTSLSAIGFLSWVGLAYSLKVFWAPLLDRLGIPGLKILGQRRGWIALMQIMVAASLISEEYTDFSDTDRVIQAFRRGRGMRWASRKGRNDSSKVPRTRPVGSSRRHSTARRAAGAPGCRGCRSRSVGSDTSP